MTAPRPAVPNGAEKQVIVTACEAFIRDVLKPRFLPQIWPTDWNYVVDIHGAWAAGRYRFIQRYRSAWSIIAAKSSMRPSPVSTAWDETASISTGCGTPENGGGFTPA